MAIPMKRKQGCIRLLLSLLLVQRTVAQIDCTTGYETNDTMDQARLILDVTAVTTPKNLNVTLKAEREECVTCNLKQKVNLQFGTTCAVMLDTRWKMRLAVNISQPRNDTEVDRSCGEKELSQQFKEYGNYTMYIALSNNILTCKTMLLNNPYDSNIPIYVALGVFVVVVLIYIVALNIYRHRREYLNRLLISTGAENLIDPTISSKATSKAIPAKSTHPSVPTVRNRRRNKAKEVEDLNAYMSQDLGNMQTNINPTDNTENKPKKERLRSLDTFRGISIVVMIFVNYGGGGYWFFKHSRWNGLTIADLVFPCLTIMNFVNYGGGGYWFFDHSHWNGLTVADLVFPWFVWIMGTSMAFSYKSLLLNMTPKWKIFLKIFKRSCILFLLGLLINSGGCKEVYLPEFRIPGVLQRFAGTYLIIATMHMFFAKTADTNMHKWWNPLRDVIDYWFEWVLNFAIIALHVAITFGLDVPGCPKGYLGPGGLADGGKYPNCTGGAAGYIDRKFFGAAHIYQSPTCKEIYNTSVAYDPEGLLGTLTSCFMCFLGLQAGKILMIYKEPKKIVIRYCIWGVFLCVIAAILCEFKRDGGFIPINKNLWSLSFVLCLGGFAFFLLTVCYLTIDVWKIWNGAPFYYPGMNSIAMYIAHIVFQPYFPIGFHIDNTHWELLALHLWGPAFWCFLTYIMYRRKIFIAI